MMDKNEIRETIAKRVALEFKDGNVVNLGIGLPTLIPNYLPKGVNVILQTENGLIGIGPSPKPGEEDPTLVNAGGLNITALPFAAAFDSSASFGIIRGGHVDITVLGALQVDQDGNIANWMIPGKLTPGMGGAMDLLVGSKRVIVAMEHTAKGNIKIMETCKLPLTAAKEVNLIVTEMGVIEVTENGLVLKEYNPRFTIEEIQNNTEAKLIIADDIKEMKQ
jgi:acetate CoA/acetoacetate CoA-transferase beta subunit